MQPDYKKILQSPSQLEAIAAGLVILEYLIIIITKHGYFNWVTDTWILAGALGLVYWHRYKNEKPVVVKVLNETWVFVPKQLTLVLLIVYALYTFYYSGNGVATWALLLVAARAALYFLAFRRRYIHEPLRYQSLLLPYFLPITIALALCMVAMHKEMAYVQTGGGLSSGLELQHSFEYEPSKGGYEWDYRYRPSTNYTPGTLIFFDGHELPFGFELTVALLFLLVTLTLSKRPGPLLSKLFFFCLAAWWLFEAEGFNNTDFTGIWLMLAGILLLGMQVFFPQKLQSLFQNKR